ncbi:rhomboid family intramembrane serine protease [Kroppenstedtia pulmonis]|uniref:Rhomboid family intramembrane serine protease n=1 Tax=Kroppenstedtia pulmonis TaxID=1380685 RepID=A0A7D4BI58_9BACL|nr:rhomboid family intramembrane serine protease [Kroppenstedtia pulmonis]QKG85115.1 rhomboid family intramembrane serine protease [Kroppenstedtia pulmonis]
MFNHTQLPLRRFRSYFPVVTGILLIQTLLFLMMTISGGSMNVETLIRFGALESHLLQSGEWWRLITPIFLHIGWMHFLLNSFALYLFGPQLEWLFGKFYFAVFYLTTGIVANLATVWINLSAISAGASGAIYGLFGVYAYLFLFRKGSIDPETGKGLMVLLGINIIIGFLDPRTNFVAHIGGLIAGLLLAGPLLRLKRG